MKRRTDTEAALWEILDSELQREPEPLPALLSTPQWECARRQIEGLRETLAAKRPDPRLEPPQAPKLVAAWKHRVLGWGEASDALREAEAFIADMARAIEAGDATAAAMAGFWSGNRAGAVAVHLNTARFHHAYGAEAAQRGRPSNGITEPVRLEWGKRVANDRDRLMKRYHWSKSAAGRHIAPKLVAAASAAPELADNHGVSWDTLLAWEKAYRGSKAEKPRT